MTNSTIHALCDYTLAKVEAYVKFLHRLTAKGVHMAIAFELGPKSYSAALLRYMVKRQCIKTAPIAVVN